MKSIIRELKDSDCYLFVNFRRERRPAVFRGSLFSNQEFAIAYAMGFDRILVINQKGVKREGMLAHIGCNTDDFDKPSSCLKAVKKALDESNWTPDYSRGLIAGRTSFSDLVAYSDGLTQLKGRILYLDILNRRPDTAAMETTARLRNFRQAETKTWTASEIRSPLKATKVFLNCALDLLPKPCVPITYGVWELEYEFYAIGFPVLTVVVELTWSHNGQLAAKILRQENS